LALELRTFLEVREAEKKPVEEAIEWAWHENMRLEGGWELQRR
jgi:hypothetical protein